MIDAGTILQMLRMEHHITRHELAKQFGTTYFSTQSFIYKSYSQKNGVGKASDCTECEACVEKCPQHLDIPRFMGDVREMFE